MKPRKSITTEAKIENVRRFVRAYGELAGHIDQVDDLQHQIGYALKQACESGPTYDSVGSILGRHLKKPEQVSRKSAWLAQHHTRTRAFCVGNQLVQQQGDVHFSTPLRQLEHLGYAPKNVPFSSFIAAVGERKWIKRVDAVLVQPETSTITIVKSCSYEQACHVRDDDNSVLEANLWVPRPVHVHRTLVPSRLMVTLTLSEMVLRSAFPDWNVRCVAMVVDAAAGSWQHEAYRVDGCILQAIEEPYHDVSGFERIWSEPSGQPEDFSSLPAVPAAMPLNALPVDRASRSRMILDRLWRRQAACGGLATMTVSEITKEIRDEHLVQYTPDWRRHDIEDCLAVGGFVERLAYEKKCYVLTPLGVFEAMVTRQQLKPASGFGAGSDVVGKALAAIRHQARLLAQYAAGEQVISDETGMGTGS